MVDDNQKNPDQRLRSTMHIFLELHTNVKAARRKYRRRQTVLRSRSRLEKAAPTAFFRKARRKSLCLVLTMNSVQFIKVNKFQKIVLKTHFFQSSKVQVPGAGVGSGTLDFRSRSRLKKWRLRAPQHWRQQQFTTTCLISFFRIFLL